MMAKVVAGSICRCQGCQRDINKAKEEYKENGDANAFHIKLKNIFNENAVEIPKNINTRKNPTKRLWDFLTRNEEYLVRKRAQSYVSSTS